MGGWCLQSAYRGSVMAVVFCKKVTPVVGNITLYTGNELNCDGDLCDNFHKVISIIELCLS